MLQHSKYAVLLRASYQCMYPQLTLLVLHSPL